MEKSKHVCNSWGYIIFKSAWIQFSAYILLFSYFEFVIGHFMLRYVYDTMYYYVHDNETRSQIIFATKTAESLANNLWPQRHTLKEPT